MGLYFKKLNGDDDRIIRSSVTQSLMTGVIYHSSMGSDSSGPEAKEASSNKKKFVPLDSMLRSWRELGAVNERHKD